jgi:hypothetical protein
MTRLVEAAISKEPNEIGEHHDRDEPKRHLDSAIHALCSSTIRRVLKTKVFETAPAVRLKGLAYAQFALRGCNDRA